MCGERSLVSTWSLLHWLKSWHEFSTNKNSSRIKRRTNLYLIPYDLFQSQKAALLILKTTETRWITISKLNFSAGPTRASDVRPFSNFANGQINFAKLKINRAVAIIIFIVRNCPFRRRPATVTPLCTKWKKKKIKQNENDAKR